MNLDSLDQDRDAVLVIQVATLNQRVAELESALRAIESMYEMNCIEDRACQLEDCKNIARAVLERK